jgi:hypothetical protein
MSGDNFDHVIQAVTWMRQFLEEHGQTMEGAANRLREMGIPEDTVRGALVRIEQLQQGALDGTGGALVIRGIGAAKPWYMGPDAKHLFWPSLKAQLAQDGWAEEDITELDSSSNIVLASCQSPWETSSDGRGLVIGHVQSGKTTHFTAVAAKAADAGFRLIIVLSGVTKSLRQQTQKRLDAQLRDLQPNSWVHLTDPLNDVGSIPGIHPILENLAFRTYAVSKKNVSRLKRLNSFLEKAERMGHLANCPILVIDDEGDQASLSPNCDQRKATAINKQIVKLLQRPRISYVAYTATPFANVFVSPFHNENLYPRDFICSLREPASYFGATRMFGDGVTDPGVDAIRTINSAEEDDYFGTDSPRRGASIEEAVRWFLLAATVRRIRNGGIQPHTTMLVNASEKIQYHFDMWPIIAGIVKGIRSRLPNDPLIRAEFGEQWATESTRVPASDFGLAHPSFDEIWEELPRTISLLGNIDGQDHDSDPSCGIVVDNYMAEVRLAYDNSAPRPIIVIGGNTLARGLTLEGLVCSVFARSTKLYDSLLQMGRWFGYRRGYEDLPRVWMFRESSDRFEYLARIEQEIRQEVDRYAETGLSPLDFGVRIRRHPVMQITKQAFLRSARKISFDFSGTRPQTTFFENDSATISRAQTALSTLERSMLRDAPPTLIPQGLLFKDVNLAHIKSFFDPKTGYPLSESNEYFNSRPLNKYLRKKEAHGEILKWNVVLRSISGGRQYDGDLTSRIGMARRSRLTSSKDKPTIAIGTLTDPGDQFLDVPPGFPGSPSSWRSKSSMPLLVAYVIDKDSTAPTRDNRADLNAAGHLVGIAVYFPVSGHQDDTDNHVVVRGPWDLKSVGDEDEDDENEVEDTEGDDPVPPANFGPGE